MKNGPGEAPPPPLGVRLVPERAKSVAGAGQLGRVRNVLLKFSSTSAITSERASSDLLQAQRARACDTIGSAKTTGDNSRRLAATKLIRPAESEALARAPNFY